MFAEPDAPHHRPHSRVLSGYGRGLRHRPRGTDRRPTAAHAAARKPGPRFAWSWRWTGSDCRPNGRRTRSSRCDERGRHGTSPASCHGIRFPFVHRFDDRTQQQIDFRPVLHGELYGALRDTAVFERVAIDPDAHTLVWPNGADFDPTTLHDWPDAGPRMIELARCWADAERFGRTAGDEPAARFRIIGVDCATKDVRTGLALAASDDNGVRLLEATVGNFEGGSTRSILEKWLADSEVRHCSPSMPRSAGRDRWPLVAHRRRSDWNLVFRRLMCSKTQPERGGSTADRIARTALALRLLEELRSRLGAAIPLVWDPEVIEHGDRLPGRHLDGPRNRYWTDRLQKKWPDGGTS